MVVQTYSTWRFTLMLLSYLRKVFQECQVIAVVFSVSVTVPEAQLVVSACARCDSSGGD